MVAQAVQRKAATRPVEWDALMPFNSSERVKWQVWMRPKGVGYWLMRYATKLARFLCELEKRLGRDVPPAPANPNGLEDGGTFDTEEEARDLCRIYHEQTKGRYAITYTPVLIGRAYPPRPVMAAGDRYFDPFKVFDFSATDAVKEQATHVLVSVDLIEQLTSDLNGIRRTAEPRL